MAKSVFSTGATDAGQETFGNFEVMNQRMRVLEGDNPNSHWSSMTSSRLDYAYDKLESQIETVAKTASSAHKWKGSLDVGAIADAYNLMADAQLLEGANAMRGEFEEHAWGLNEGQETLASEYLLPAVTDVMNEWMENRDGWEQKARPSDIAWAAAEAHMEMLDALSDCIDTMMQVWQPFIDQAKDMRAVAQVLQVIDLILDIFDVFL